MSAYGNCSGLAKRDQVLNNLVVCENAVFQKGVILPRNAIPFTAAPSFELMSNQSFVFSGNMFQLAIKGVVTGDVQLVPTPIGSIPAAYAPLVSLIAANCVPNGFPLPTPPEFILVAEVDPDGKIHTCTSGAPFTPGSYEITINVFYMR